MFGGKIEEMDDGKNKELMKILEGKAKPFLQKCDGYACKVDEDKEITYKDHGDQELTLKVPAGSYIVVGKDSCYPEIETAESFEGKNKFVEGEEKHKMKDKKSGPSIGMEVVAETQNPNY